MDPLWAAFAEFWWIGPIVIGSGALGWFGLRGQRTARARRLAFDASRAELGAARKDAVDARIAVRVARAELARALAERGAGRADGADIARARRTVDAAQRETKAAAAIVRVRRANLVAARAALGTRSSDPAQLPLGRLMAEDDAVTARWLEYETDPARLIAFPAMTDARVPTTAAFSAELRTTRALRPASPDARITVAQFTAYRDAIARLDRAFHEAEAEAWRRARAAGDLSRWPSPGDPDAAPQSGYPGAPWVLTAQEIAQNLAQTVLTRGAEALARATAPRSPATDADSGARPTRAEHPAPNASTAPAGSEPTRPPAAPPPPTWPVPSRTTRPSGS